MTKKIALVASCVFVVVALVVALIFVFSGDTPAPEEKSVSVEGTWKVTAHVANGITTISDNEYIVFDATMANCYKDDLTTPYATSVYSIDGETMKCDDISMTYIIDYITDNIIDLYETPDIHMILVRYPNGDMSAIETDASVLDGKWEVVCHSGSIVSGEYLDFKDGTFDFYRSSPDTPDATTDYVWGEGGHLIVDAWAKDMLVHKIAEDVIILLETESGYVWELKKA